MKLRDIIIVVAIALSIFLVTRLVIQNFVVEGDSMNDNLETGQWILVSKLAYEVGEPTRGDIIVFNNPESNPSTPVLIKRIIGLPGDTVKVAGGKVYIDDELLTEAYIDVPTNRDGTWSITEGHYFVMGDNRGNSKDSRLFGAISRESIIGKAWLRIWPFSAWGFAPNYRPSLTD
jgi:signal peptidase I